MFDHPAEDGSMADFIVTANVDLASDEGSTPEGSPQPRSANSQLFVSLSDNTSTSPLIHVHKMILQARWPHFKTPLLCKDDRVSDIETAYS